MTPITSCPMARQTDADLDDILENALEEVDDGDEGAITETRGAGAAGGGRPAGLSAAEAAARAAADAERRAEASSKEVAGMTEGLESLMKNLEDPAFVGQLDKAFEQLAAGDADNIPEFLRPFVAAAAAPADGAAAASGGTGEQVDAGVAETLKLLAEASKGMEGMDPGAAEAMGEDVMRRIMQDFEKMADKEDMGDVMENMMRQLVSKDIMYEPMAKICEKFPAWLAEHEQTLPAADFERYGRQYQFFQRILAVYDAEPDNHARIMELMQDMQECGAPPADIIKDLAPGLEFGSDGLPVLPTMGGAAPGPAGLPVGPDGQPCSVM